MILAIAYGFQRQSQTANSAVAYFPSTRLFLADICKRFLGIDLLQPGMNMLQSQEPLNAKACMNAEELIGLPKTICLKQKLKTLLVLIN